MPLGINSYVDPGVYIAQKLQPGSVTLTADRTLCVVAIAPRTRRVTDEAVVRGKVYDETLTVNGSTYRATLVNVSDRNRSTATLYRNGNALGLGDWSFIPAFLVGSEWAGGTIDVSSGTGTAQYFTLSMDGKRFVTLNMHAAVTAIGGTPATATAANICDAINYELGNVAGTYYAVYGASYASVATNATGSVNKIITLTSPDTSSASSIIVALSMASTNDGASEISNTAWAPTVNAGVQADTVMQLVSTLYSSSDAYTIDYVAVDMLLDALTYATSDTPLSALIRVGSYPGSSLYVQDTDYEDNANNLDWDVSAWTQATITGVNGPFTATGTDIKLAINGLTPLTVTLTTNLPNPAAADVVADINTALNASTVYGPLYSHVATVSGSAVKLTAPSILPNTPVYKGAASSIEFFAGTTAGVTVVFGIASGSLPYETLGVGNRPYFGSVFYTTYDYTRDSADYDLPHIVYNTDQVYEYCSPITLANYPRNKLAIAGEIAFANGISRLYLAQINDSTAPGTPTPSQVNAAIDICEEKSDITDIVVIDTEEAQAVHLMEHVANMSSMIEKKYRRGWFGMARGTDIGDPDTSDTFVYRATTTLQPGATSTGRGRLVLCAPSDISRTQVLDDSAEVTLELDGSYLAVACAARFCALTNPSDALLGKTVAGFLSDDSFQTYLQSERLSLASQGVNVVTSLGGRLEMKDPLTTEAGGAGVVEFEEISSSAQKDAVTRAVEQVLDGNVKGVVPDDLADFIVDIKTWISLAIKGMINNGTIAPFRNADGTTRDISLITDIQAYQDESDPRSFIFKYWFNLKYVAKRFFGEYSVDNPFFTNE